MTPVEFLNTCGGEGGEGGGGTGDKGGRRGAGLEERGACCLFAVFFEGVPALLRETLVWGDTH